jgi:ABC-type uncharacterized transport system permease subunit
MQNALLAAVITLIIFAFIGFIVVALMVIPIITGVIIVFLCMAIVFMLIHQSLKKDNEAN